MTAVASANSAGGPQMTADGVACCAGVSSQGVFAAELAKVCAEIASAQMGSVADGGAAGSDLRTSGVVATAGPGDDAGTIGESAQVGEEQPGAGRALTASLEVSHTAHANVASEKVSAQLWWDPRFAASMKSHECGERTARATRRSLSHAAKAGATREHARDIASGIKCGSDAMWHDTALSARVKAAQVPAEAPSAVAAASSAEKASMAMVIAGEVVPPSQASHRSAEAVPFPDRSRAGSSSDPDGATGAVVGEVSGRFATAFDASSALKLRADSRSLVRDGRAGQADISATRDALPFRGADVAFARTREEISSTNVTIHFDRNMSASGNVTDSLPRIVVSSVAETVSGSAKDDVQHGTRPWDKKNVGWDRQIVSNVVSHPPNENRVGWGTQVEKDTEGNHPSRAEAPLVAQPFGTAKAMPLRAVVNGEFSNNEAVPLRAVVDSNPISTAEGVPLRTDSVAEDDMDGEGRGAVGATLTASHPLNENRVEWGTRFQDEHEESRPLGAKACSRSEADGRAEAMPGNEARTINARVDDAEAPTTDVALGEIEAINHPLNENQVEWGTQVEKDIEGNHPSGAKAPSRSEAFGTAEAVPLRIIAHAEIDTAKAVPLRIIAHADIDKAEAVPLRIVKHVDVAQSDAIPFRTDIGATAEFDSGAAVPALTKTTGEGWGTQAIVAGATFAANHPLNENRVEWDTGFQDEPEESRPSVAKASSRSQRFSTAEAMPLRIVERLDVAKAEDLTLRSVERADVAVDPVLSRSVERADVASAEAVAEAVALTTSGAAGICTTDAAPLAKTPEPATLLDFDVTGATRNLDGAKIVSAPPVDLGVSHPPNENPVGWGTQVDVPVAEQAKLVPVELNVVRAMGKRVPQEKEHSQDVLAPVSLVAAVQSKQSAEASPSEVKLSPAIRGNETLGGSQASARAESIATVNTRALAARAAEALRNCEMHVGWTSEQLGRVEIKAAVHGQEVSAAMRVESDAGRQWLAAELPRLADALSRHELNVGSLHVADFGAGSGQSRSGGGQEQRWVSSSHRVVSASASVDLLSADVVSQERVSVHA